VACTFELSLRLSPDSVGLTMDTNDEVHPGPININKGKQREEDAFADDTLPWSGLRLTSFQTLADKVTGWRSIDRSHLMMSCHIKK
jgi:hypothetical protein